MKNKVIQMPKLQLAGDIRAETFNAETRTVTVVASTGSRVRRGGYFSEPFFQELEVSKRAIDMARYKNGAPVLDTHGNTKGFLQGGVGIRDVMGVVENPRIEKVKRTGEKEETNALVVDVRFSEREEFAGLLKDIESRVIRNVSIGFNIHNNKELEERVGEAKIFRATRWEPVELSFVPAGADPDSVSRNYQGNSLVDCEFEFINDNERGIALKTPKDTGAAAGVAQNENANDGDDNVTPIDETKIRREAMEAERKRAADIRLAVRSAKLGGEVADQMIERGISADEARTEVLATLADADEKAATRSTNIEAGEDLSQVERQRGMGLALQARIDPTMKLDDGQRQSLAPFKFQRLLDMARSCVEARGESTRGLSPMELATRGLHSTSDFPLILAGVVNNTLRRAYEESPQTFAPFTRRVTVSDFRDITRTQLGDAPTLQKKLENGEYQSGSVGEAAEKYSVEEYGKIVPIGRRVIVNDDLDAFARLPGMMGRQARNLESDLIWTDLLSNPLMADGFALFSAQHANLGTPAAFGEATLAEARELMRLQTGLGESKLNLVPTWLFTPVALETAADKQLTAVTAAAVSDVNIFGPNGKTPLRNLAEPRIDDVTQTGHYLTADNGSIDQYELATLVGEEGPVTDSEIDFMTDGIKFKIRHTVGVKAIDWRGMVYNAGA